MTIQEREKMYLCVEMPDGIWQIPISIIAKNRANFYASKGDSFEEEYEYTIGDDFEIKDWAANNMNWEDVQNYAVRIESPPKLINRQECWMNNPKWIK